MFARQRAMTYVIAMALLLGVALVGTTAMAAPPGTVAAGLANPRGIAVAADGTLYVADAGANDLLRVDPQTGQTSLVTTFAGIPRPTANPARGGREGNNPVPSDVVIGPDGNFYVGLLTGFPTVEGGAKVLRVTPGGAVSEAVAGLTSVSGLNDPDSVAFDWAGNLYVAVNGSAAASPSAVAASSGTNTAQNASAHFIRRLGDG
jgi:sugar lactone lactonase YvrE